jgi:hypothetical protein
VNTMGECHCIVPFFVRLVERFEGFRAVAAQYPTYLSCPSFLCQLAAIPVRRRCCRNVRVGYPSFCCPVYRRSCSAPQLTAVLTGETRAYGPLSSDPTYRAPSAITAPFTDNRHVTLSGDAIRSWSG